MSDLTGIFVYLTVCVPFAKPLRLLLYRQLLSIGPPLIRHPRHQTQILKEQNSCIVM